MMNHQQYHDGLDSDHLQAQKPQQQQGLEKPVLLKSWNQIRSEKNM